MDYPGTAEYTQSSWNDLGRIDFCGPPNAYRSAQAGPVLWLNWRFLDSSDPGFRTRQGMFVLSLW